MSASIIQFRSKAATNSDVAIKPATHQPDVGVPSQDLAAGSTPAASFGDEAKYQAEIEATRVEMARD